MEAMGAPWSYSERATGPLIDAGCWSAWVRAAGETQGMLSVYAGALTEVQVCALRPLDLHTHDAGAMLPSDPS